MESWFQYIEELEPSITRSALYVYRRTIKGL